MKSDADTIRSFLIGLLEHFSQLDASPSGQVDATKGTAAPPGLAPDSPTTVERASASASDPAVEAAIAPHQFSSPEVPPISELGELPSVQDHFQTVLKRRLQIEISQNPPRFPWESTVTDYPVELTEASTYPWLVQLRSLALPTTLPDDILTGLLSRCQELIRESLQPGVQLVKAVENLFPDQPQAMDQIAGLVLANATMRSSTATQDMAALKAAFPDGYDGANPQQQVTLTMLAAKDILETLTLSLTPQQPLQARQWQTSEGAVAITAQYQVGLPNHISLAVAVPCASQMTLPSLGQTVTQTRPGTLNLTLPEPIADTTYPVEVYFSGTEAAPLTFAIRWSEST
ncbi:hypothetical protein [Leptolyngbya iicbica]|uniref:PatU n=2 Tax=Cyanophyceae TaxID=3028117 RepID=A0A4Q7E0Y0_9CYAN|nr:hypothetical protein [Leptolyngbya sp. LK]RZM75588.1 hypothetical protein DYY88_19980 [Leptolyngbya sp. LK]